MVVVVECHALEFRSQLLDDVYSLSGGVYGVYDVTWNNIF